ncbi:hypothetical protein [Sutcliffiella deserti]|uniref:hypothetical protein n=1 Tax=Sutcliffiella deserti TaxID=2875501 RepID=UPI001CBB4BFA|nr:hypothetical protein [Sutcliffiella deserti]
MLRTNYLGKEVILRIKPNIRLYSLTEQRIYETLVDAIDVIYHMESFAVVVDDQFWIVGETQQSAYPLITILNIVPAQNIIEL